MDPQRQAFRAHILASFGASGSVIEELLGSGAEHDLPAGANPFRLPLEAETHVAAWQAYAAKAAQRGAWETLRQRFPQFLFPICQGISQTEAYRAATRRGEIPESSPGLHLHSPDRLRLWMQDGLAGPIPVLSTADRDDFVCLVQALSSRNEPTPVPDSMGACLVSGFNNWDRIRQLQQRWLARDSRTPEGAADTWAAEFRNIIPHKELYQDRFLILAEGPYSNVPAEDMGMSPAEWLRVSLTIRLAHEGAHYLALRLFGTVLDRPMDEVIADYVGIAAACGRYRADWFLRFVGLETFPNYRAGRRLENYRGRPPLSEPAFHVLQILVRTAAENLERFDVHHFRGARQDPDRAALVPTLSQLTLEELASPALFERMREEEGRKTKGE